MHTKKALGRACLGLLAGAALAGCTTADNADGAVVWAVNVGGDAYAASDGVAYRAEEYVSGGSRGELGRVKGSQDPVLYQSFREGDVRVAKPLENGRYDITLHFAEHEPHGGGGRVFDVFAEDRLVADDIDVMRFRDGQVDSALTVTVPQIAVEDGELNISFSASADEPVLSAVVVRKVMPRTDDWQLTWADEFDAGESPDPSRWNIELWPPGKVNQEDQRYTARPENLRIEDGVLVIEAHREDFEDAKYTSARIQSQGKGDFLYGRFEIRAQLPRGQGTWPALWMLPSDPFRYATTCEEGADWQGSDTCDAWPNSGEIDIMEHVGYQMNHVHGTVHTKAYYWVEWEQRKGRILLDDVADEFHVYAMEWSPERIDMFVDDTLYFTYVNENQGWREWPFDHAFHLVMNLAVGGVWGRAGGPIDDSVFPQRLLVDYVRVYERATN